MNSPELLRTDYYVLIKEEHCLRVTDLRTLEFRFIKEDSLSIISLLTSEGADDYFIEQFR